MSTAIQPAPSVADPNAKPPADNSKSLSPAPMSNGAAEPPSDSRKRKRRIVVDQDEDDDHQQEEEQKKDKDAHSHGDNAETRKKSEDGHHGAARTSDNAPRTPAPASKAQQQQEAATPPTINSNSTAGDSMTVASKSDDNSPTVSSPGADAVDQLEMMRRQLQQMAEAKAEAEARLAAEIKARVAAETRRGGSRGRSGEADKEPAEEVVTAEPLPDEPWAMTTERRSHLIEEAGRVLAAAEEHWRQLETAQREAMAAAGPTRSDRARAKTAGIAQAGVWIRAWGLIHYQMACLYKETIAGGRAARVGRGVPTDPEELAKAEARAYAPLMVERIRMARFFHDTARRFHQQFAPPVDSRGCAIKPQMAPMSSRNICTVALSHPALAAVAVGPEVAEIAALPENGRSKPSSSSSSSSSSRAKGSPLTLSPTTSSPSSRPAKRSRTSAKSSGRGGSKPRRMSARDFVDDEVDDDDEDDDEEEEDDDESLDSEEADFIDDGDEDVDSRADEDDDEDEKAARKRKMASLAAKAQAAKTRRR